MSEDSLTLPAGLHETLVEAFGGVEAATDRIIELLLTSGAEALGVQDAAVLVPRTAETLGFLAATNAALLKPGLPPVPVGSSIAGFVYVSAQTMSFDQAGAAPEFFDKIDKAAGYSTKEYLAAPVVGGETMLGVLTFVNRTGGKGPFSPGEIELASRYASLCGLVMQYKERSQQLVSETMDALAPVFDEAGRPSRTSAPMGSGGQLQAKSAIVEALDGLGEGELELVRDLIERLGGSGPELAF